MTSAHEMAVPFPAIDMVATEAAIARLLVALGEDVESARLRATPARAATACSGS